MLGECFCMLLPEKSLIDDMDTQVIALMTLYLGARSQVDTSVFTRDIHIFIDINTSARNCTQ